MNLVRHYRLFDWLILTFLVGLCGCRTGTGTTDQAKRTAVSGTVANLTKATNGSFRYYGEFILQAPSRYHGKRVGLFIISHERDVREYVGKTISFPLEDDDLTRSVEPAPDPFSVSQPEPQLSLEFDNGVFHALDYLSYEKPVSIRGLVRGYARDKDNGGLYFQFDMGYSGDMASVEITDPAKYRGLIIHVLVDDEVGGRSGRRDKWSRIGATVTFSVSESILAWESWGFTPVGQLATLTIDAKQGE
jgi:hypothetical protein